jgi:hypothetical protein
MAAPLTSNTSTFTRGRKSGINYDSKLEIILLEVGSACRHVYQVTYSTPPFVNHHVLCSSLSLSFPSPLPLGVASYRMFLVWVLNTSKLALSMGMYIVSPKHAAAPEAASVVTNE